MVLLKILSDVSFTVAFCVIIAHEWGAYFATVSSCTSADRCFYLGSVFLVKAPLTYLYPRWVCHSLRRFLHCLSSDKCVSVLGLSFNFRLFKMKNLLISVLLLNISQVWSPSKQRGSLSWIFLHAPGLLQLRLICHIAFLDIICCICLQIVVQEMIGLLQQHWFSHL